MKRILNYQITTTMTVDQFLQSKGYTRKLIISLKHSHDGICVNTLPVFTNYVLKTGDTLTITLTDKDSSESILPVNLPFFILYEDEDLMVINKPANMPVHPSQGNYDNTLANGLAFYFAQTGQPFVFRAINRLDKDTTGLLIIGKNRLSSSILSNMVKNRLIHRTYLAIASGKVPPIATIHAPIARKEGSTIEREVNLLAGEDATTHYQLLYYDPTTDCSCVRLKLETGRTHQIRVHMKHIGHPLLGDFLYHPDYRYLKRQALHSFHLAFTHPITGESLSFFASLPDDMTFCLPSDINLFENDCSSQRGE